MDFEWDEDKNRRNIAKHGISFEDASKIFDGFTVDLLGDRFDDSEAREISIGLLHRIAFVVVVHTDRDGVCRIISARPATKSERKLYDQAIQKAFDA